MQVDTFTFAGGTGKCFVISRDRTPAELRHDALVKFFRETSGWLCAHKSLERLEAEFASACKPEFLCYGRDGLGRGTSKANRALGRALILSFPHPCPSVSIRG